VETARTCADFATPINEVKPDEGGNGKTNNPTDIADTDHTIAQNLIGEIVNLSQLLNSYYWHMKHNKADKKTLTAIYKRICVLSSLSQIEIDRAKKTYVVDADGYLGECRKQEYIERGPEPEDSKKQAPIEYPNFFRYIKKDAADILTKHFDTPMDYIYDVIKGIPKRGAGKKREDIKTKHISKLVDAPKWGSVYDDHITHFKETCLPQIEILEGMEADADTDYYAKIMKKREIKESIIKDLRRKKYSELTLRALIYKCFTPKRERKKGASINKYHDPEIYGARIRCISLLYDAYGDDLMKCFKRK
jgi:hypothetical protein